MGLVKPIMFKLLFILFVIKLHVRINIYKFTLFILNEDMNDTIKITKSLWDLPALIDGVTKQQEGRFLHTVLTPLAASLIQPMIFSVVKGITGRGVKRAGKGYMDKDFYFQSIL